MEMDIYIYYNFSCCIFLISLLDMEHGHPFLFAILIIIPIVVAILKGETSPKSCPHMEKWIPVSWQKKLYMIVLKKIPFFLADLVDSNGKF